MALTLHFRLLIIVPEPVGPVPLSLLLLLFLHLILPTSAQQPPLLLDRLFCDAAFETLHKFKPPRMSTPYKVDLPPTLPNASAYAARFRTGSLILHGTSIGKFRIPPRIAVQYSTSTHPRSRLVLIAVTTVGNLYYHTNHSSTSRQHYSLVSPVLSLLVYDAFDHHSQLEIHATQEPISVSFGSQQPSSDGDGDLLCASLGFDGTVNVIDEVLGTGKSTPGGVCSTRKQGHFGLVRIIKKSFSTTASLPPAGRPPPAPLLMHEGKQKSIVAEVAVGGGVAVVLLGMVAVALVKRKEREELVEMERRAYEEEMLHISMVGHVRAPTAGASRTKPVIEEEFMSEW